MMSERPPDNPLCQTALAALERDPLELPAAVEAHLETCAACFEARVFWLALEEAPEVEVPQGYFATLGFRILRKLPPRKRSQGLGYGRQVAGWLAAAGLLAALGLGATGFFMGRAVRTPVVEAAQPKDLVETFEQPTETPFSESEDPVSQLSNVSPKQADEALQRLQTPEPSRP